MKYKFRRFKLHKYQLGFGILWILTVIGAAFIDIKAIVVLAIGSFLMIPIALSEKDVYIKERINQ